MKKYLMLLLISKLVILSFSLLISTQNQSNILFSYQQEEKEKNKPIESRPHKFNENDKSEIKEIGFYKRNNLITIRQIPQNVKKVPNELPVEIESLFGAFANRFEHHENVMGFENWNTSKIKDMSYVFSNNHIFNGDLSNWNTENVENMQGMFKNAINFDNSGKPLNWKTDKVTSMESMFDGAKSFNQNLMSWKVDKVIKNRNFSRGSGFFEENNKKPKWMNIKEENDPIDKPKEDPKVIIHPSPPKPKVNIPLTRIITPATKHSPTLKPTPDSKKGLEIPKANLNTTNQQAKKLSTPAIVGIVVGSQVVLTSLAVGTPYLIKKFKK
ncbi:BspA family leucine-rich repeat surface protein [Mycoplasma capricolum]|uniref:BspA family leucine-rich repeat surface protein n=1 Tax=Mycoplasma capricolum TaxID=2095 RepID=UPI003DA468C6